MKSENKKEQPQLKPITIRPRQDAEEVFGKVMQELEELLRKNDRLLRGENT